MKKILDLNLPENTAKVIYTYTVGNKPYLNIREAGKLKLPTLKEPFFGALWFPAEKTLLVQSKLDIESDFDLDLFVKAFDMAEAVIRNNPDLMFILGYSKDIPADKQREVFKLIGERDIPNLGELNQEA